MRQQSGLSLRDALADRGEFLRVILIGSLLALGINFITSSVDAFLEFVSAPANTTPAPSIASTIILAGLGIFLILLSIVLLGTRIFGARRITKGFEAVLIHDPTTKMIAPILEYEFSEQVNRVLNAIFQENIAFKNIWEKEPPIMSAPFPKEEGEPKTNTRPEPRGKTDNYSYVAVMKMVNKDDRPEPKSFSLMREVLEFVILEQLSTHLSSYFDSLGEKGEKFVKEYTREDIPDLLLKNRVLSLLSSPLDARAPFSEYALSDKQDDGEIHLLMRSDGYIFSRFDLRLPRGSKIYRISSNKLRIDSKRLQIDIFIDYRGFGTAIPNEFLYYYVGCKEPRKAVCQQVLIQVEANLKGGTLFLPGGWELYQWIDSFIDSLDDFGSFDTFMNRINWPHISAFMYTQSRIASRRAEQKKKLDAVASESEIVSNEDNNNDENINIDIEK